MKMNPLYNSLRCCRYLVCALLIALLVLLCACNSTPEPNDDPATDPSQDSPVVEQPSVAFPIAPTDEGYAYKVIRHDASSQYERDAMITICSTLKEIYGSLPAMDINYESENADQAEIAARIELLIGNTGRPESDAVYDAMAEGEYTVRTVGNKLIILGKTDELTALAVDEFLKIIQSAPSELEAGYNFTNCYLRGEYTGPIDFDALGYPQLTDVRFEYRAAEGNSQILYLTSDEYHYTCGYYSNNKWINGDIMIAARSANDNAIEFGVAELVAVDLREKKAWLLPILASDYDNYVVDNELIYYIPNNHDLRCLSLFTGSTSTILSMENIDFPHSTLDGEYINVARQAWGHFCTIVETSTGKHYDLLPPEFDPPYTVPNHMMICPTDPTIAFFSHEGDTTEVSDRLWIVKLGEEAYNIAYQRTDEQGKPIDCFGHECWAPDGKGLYFVKYNLSPSKPTGICYVSLDDIENPQVLYSKYSYWHTACSPNQKFLAADGLDSGYSGVYLIDLKTDEEILVYKAQTYHSQHPGHPHPRFNIDSTALVFNDHNTQNGRVSIGIYYLFS